jgi:hypothetical protein
VFDTEPPKSVLDEIAEVEEMSVAAGSRRPTLEEQFPMRLFAGREAVNGGERSRLGCQDFGDDDGGEEQGSEPGRHLEQEREQRQGQQEQHVSDRDKGKSSQSPAVHRHNKPARKDSIVDYGAEGDGALTEANDRLQKLEESVQRIEEMISKLLKNVKSDESEDGDLFKTFRSLE